MLTRKILMELGAGPAGAARFLTDLNRLTRRHAIDSPLRLAHFLAQVGHESGHWKRVEENLN